MNERSLADQVEAVAKAIRATHPCWRDWEHVPEEIKEDYRLQARAAIDALRSY